MDGSPDSFRNDKDGPLTRLFGSSGRIRIVETFLGKRGIELTAAELAKLAGVDRSTVSRNIDALVDTGLIERRETELSVLYRANVDDPAIEALLDVRRALLGVLAENPQLVERGDDQDPATEAYVDRSGLVRLFGSPGRVKMIEAFFETEDQELTGAEVADRAGIDRSTVSRNVDELIELGLIERTRCVGNSKMYRLDPDHSVNEALWDARCELLVRKDEHDPSRGTDSEPTERGSSESPGMASVSTMNSSLATARNGWAVGSDVGNLEDLDRRTSELKIELDAAEADLQRLESEFQEKIERAAKLSGIEKERITLEAKQIKRKHDHERSRFESALRRYVLLSTLKRARTYLDIDDPASLQDADRRTMVQLGREVVAEMREETSLDERVEYHEDAIEDVLAAIERGDLDAVDPDPIDDLVERVEREQIEPGEISLTDVVDTGTEPST